MYSALALKFIPGSTFLFFFGHVLTYGRLAIVPFMLLVGRGAFPAPPRHAGGMRQVLEPFLPPPATPAVRGRFLMDGLCLVVGSAFPSTAFLPVFLGALPDR